MSQYFVKEYSEDGKTSKIKDFFTLNSMFQYLQTLEHKKVVIFEADCLLDWS